MNKLLKYLALLCLASVAYSKTEQHVKNWENSIITGSLSEDRKLRYYLQTQINFIDNHNKFHGTNAYLGIGYAPHPNLVFFLMNGWSLILRSDGSYRHIGILREQMNWDIHRTATYDVASISRLEERKQIGDPQWLIRFRERLTLRIPFSHWDTHSFVAFNEVFLNFTHPAWNNSQAVFQQNQAFIGIGTQLTQYTNFDIGYLNQFIFKNQSNEMNNVLYLTLNAQLD